MHHRRDVERPRKPSAIRAAVNAIRDERDRAAAGAREIASLPLLPPPVDAASLAW